MSGCREEGCKGRLRVSKNRFLSPPPLSWRLALGASLLAPQGGRLTNLLPPDPQPFSPGASGRRTRMPFLPGWARVPARRRSLPRRVPPASAQRGAPAPVASSLPTRSAPARTAPAVAAAAARGEAAAQPGSPRPARRRRSRRHRCRPSPHRAHPPGHTHPAAGRTPAHPPAAPPGSRAGQMRRRAPLAPGPPPRSTARRGLLSRAPLGALRLRFLAAPWNNP